MNTLLLLAALSSQITFNTTQQGDVYTIIPEVTLTQSCLCRVQILSLREGSSGQSQTKQEKTLSLNRPGFPGECFICELRLPDHRFRWKHNKLFLLLPEEYGPAFPAIVDCYTSPPT